MSMVAGECFLVLTPNSVDKSVIFGRKSSESKGEPQEVIYYDASGSLSEEKCDGGAEIDSSSGSTHAIILQKSSPGIWGGDYGANEKNVSVGITWSDGEPESDSVRSTDLVRLALARASTAEEAIDEIGSIVSAHGADGSKFSFVICDPSEVWLISTGGKLWAAQRNSETFKRLSSDGMTVSTSIDKSSPDLGESLKTLGLWDGEEDLNFAKCFGSPCSEIDWSDENLSGNGVYSLTNMFETLRSTANDLDRSATVSTLCENGISCHWFTATPNPRESVFKPFVFAPNPKISPLTMVLDESTTRLHKLHTQRKPEAIDNLKNLESSCVEEVNKYLRENPNPTQELDELMKDCVEAEVKFYR